MKNAMMDKGIADHVKAVDIPIATPVEANYDASQPLLLSAPSRDVLSIERCLVFHILNLVHSLIAFVFVWVIASLGLGFIPLCCLGLCILRIGVYFLHFFARVDAKLHNFVSTGADQIILRLPTVGFRGIIAGHRVSFGSPLSLDTFIAIIYFGIIKLPIAIGAFGLALALWIVSLFFIVLPSIRHGIFGTLIEALTSICKSIIKTCCCEYFSNLVYLEIDTSYNTV